MSYRIMLHSNRRPVAPPTHYWPEYFAVQRPDGSFAQNHKGVLRTWATAGDAGAYGPEGRVMRSTREGFVAAD